MARFVPFLCLFVCTLVVARPPDAKDKGRVYDGKISDEEHFNEAHNSEYDHEAFLGNEKKTYDQLTPEESKERLGKLVDRIDKDNDGKVTEAELKAWIKITSKRYIYDDVDRQWNHLKKMESSSRSLVQIHDGETVDKEAPISWEKYKNLTYGYITEDDQFDYKEMVRRDKRRWDSADIDKDDELTKAEYIAFLHPEEFNYTKDVVVDETMEDIDKDKDGVVSLAEYLGDLYPESETKDEKEEPDWVKSEREHFSDYRDKNKDGKMDRDEVRDWIIPADYDHVEAEARHLIHEADTNQDKLLTKEEILDKHDVFVGSQVTEYGEALARHDEF